MTFEECLARYDPLCRKFAGAYYLSGGTWEDLLQEARVGLWRAWQQHDPSRGVPFFNFAAMVIQRQVISAVKASTRKKASLLRGYVAVELVMGSAAEPRTPDDPVLAAVLSREALSATDDLWGALTSLELDAAKLRSEGYSYAEVGTRLGVTRKVIDNALQRARKKLAAA